MSDIQLSPPYDKAISAAQVVEAALPAAKVTPDGGTPTPVPTLLVPLDPTAPGFQAAMTLLLAIWANALPVYSGSGPAPVPAGQWFMNNGTPQIAQ